MVDQLIQQSLYLLVIQLQLYYVVWQEVTNEGQNILLKRLYA